MRDDPFDQLESSHRRLEERLGELEAAAEDGDAARMGDILDWLDRSAMRHEADEEKSLFPRLEGHGELAEVIHALFEEHRNHERLQTQLRASLGDRASALTLARELAQAYRAHLAVEERELLPAARKIVDADGRAQMMEEMQSRRGRR